MQLTTILFDIVNDTVGTAQRELRWGSGRREVSKLLY